MFAIDTHTHTLTGAVQIINEIQDIIGTVNSSEVLNVLRDVLAQQMRSGEPASREFSEVGLILYT